MKTQESSKKFDYILSYLCPKLKNSFKGLAPEIKSNAQEIRIRTNKSTAICLPGKTYFLYSEENAPPKSVVVNEDDISEIIRSFCGHSIYSFHEQIRNGFITIPGGHRVGICGTAVIQNGKIENVKNITSLNIRIAREVMGCAIDFFECVKKSSGGILLAGPPSSGKTTVLRDLSRIISQNKTLNFPKTVIIDEKGEIACAQNEAPQFDIGFCDVMSAYPKHEGILRAIRYMGANVIICDEIGNENDAQALKQCFNSGVKIISTIHASNLKELLLRPQSKPILDSGAFEKIIFLKDSSSPGKINRVYEVRDVYDKNYRNNVYGFRRHSGRHACIRKVQTTHKLLAGIHGNDAYV